MSPTHWEYLNSVLKTIAIGTKRDGKSKCFVVTRKIKRYLPIVTLVAVAKRGDFFYTGEILFHFCCITGRKSSSIEPKHFLLNNFWIQWGRLDFLLGLCYFFRSLWGAFISLSFLLTSKLEMREMIITRTCQHRKLLIGSKHFFPSFFQLECFSHGVLSF